jgi:galactokinase
MLRRTLAELRASGDAAWFEPALQRLRSLPEATDARLREFFARGAPLLVARAPGRLDVMGGIADYSGAAVLELPLAVSTSAILQPLGEPRIELLSLRAGEVHTFSIELDAGELRDSDALAAWFAARPDDRWAAYVVGLVQYCLAGLPAPPAAGFRLLVDSEVPEGKGIASSAALEVACVWVIAAHLGLDVPPQELAALCQWVENHVAGAPCGIMDQMTSALGQRDRLLRLRCQPATVEGQLAVPAGYRFFGIDSGIRHAVTGADYATVRAAAFMGYRIIADVAGLPMTLVDGRARVEDSRWGGYLANLSEAEFSPFSGELPERMTGAEFLARYGGITDSVTRVDPETVYPVRAAAAHPVHEQARVERFATLLALLPQRISAAEELGALMYEAHDGYSACGLGSEGTDRLVDLVDEAGPKSGLLGAKITGGGSGGTVAVLARAASEPRLRSLAARYAAETQRAVAVYAGSSPGAAETGVLEISDPL